MICICSTCKKTIGERKPFENQEKTHGSCLDCFEVQLKNSGASNIEQKSIYLKKSMEELMDIINGDLKIMEEKK